MSDELAERRRARGDGRCWACSVWLPLSQLVRAVDENDDIFWLCRSCKNDAIASLRDGPLRKRLV